MAEFDSVRMFWRRLDEIKPPEEGYYLTYNPTLKGNEPSRFVIDYWSKQYGYFTYADGVSHWALLKVPRQRKAKYGKI
jgi:hypothetical protein